MLSRGPATVGLCEGDVAGCAKMMNAAQERLLTCREVSDAGWWGTYAEMAFNVSRDNPYLTTPRGVARLEYVDVCTFPVPVVNGFFEYLQFGDGHFPKNACPANRCEPSRWYARNPVPLFTDITAGDLIRVYPHSAVDDGLRTLISGTDTNDQVVTNLDGPVQVQGEYVTFQSPFADSTTGWNTVTGVQKDVTTDRVSYYGVNPTSGDQTLLLTMEPGETTAWYRRYYLGGLPKNCCAVPGGASNTAQVKAMVKLDLIPVAVDSDYLLIQSLEALTAEAQSIRYSEIDGESAKKESMERHVMAVRFLNGQSVHFNGRTSPSVNFSPFGNARLYRQRIGTMI